MKERYQNANGTMQNLTNGAAEVRDVLADTRLAYTVFLQCLCCLMCRFRLVDAAETVAQRSREAYDKMAEDVAALESEFILAHTLTDSTHPIQDQ